MNTIAWLGEWEKTPCPGRHSKRYPAPFARGYRYGQAACTMTAAGSWDRSPQARFWLGPEKKTLMRRIREWMGRPA